MLEDAGKNYCGRLSNRLRKSAGVMLRTLVKLVTEAAEVRLFLWKRSNWVRWE
jgi:hypothetical protein